ncbi:MAG: hypothetical protein GX902_11115 [Lentisphaerae bacterium]|nr:hypothetical protein [Lentisphaerota bacterium]
MSDVLDVNPARAQQADGAFRYRRIVVLILCLVLILSIVPFDPADLDYFAGGLVGITYPRNLLGALGANLGWVLLVTFGLGSYYLTALLLLCSLRRLFWRKGLRKASFDYVLCILLSGLGMSLLLGLFPDSAFPNLAAALNIKSFPGGVLGNFFCAAGTGWLYLLLNWTGSFLVAIALLLVPLGVIWFYDWQGLLHQRQKENAEVTPATEAAAQPEFGKISSSPELDNRVENDLAAQQALAEQRRRSAPAVQLSGGSPTLSRGTAGQDAPTAYEQPLPMNIPASPEKTSSSPAQPPAKRVPAPVVQPGTPYQLPTLKLLNAPRTSASVGNHEEIERNMKALQATLDNFNIDAEVVSYVVGPQVTLFEIATAPGVNIDRIGHLQNNISMALEATSIRLLLPIPGRNLVGIEVPNVRRTNVLAYELLSDPQWQENKMQIPLLLGKNISGKVILLDLAKAPHLLIAGATGSGKSVCMNLLITSMLYKFRPDELKLIMADPKVVEFLPYKTLPHLIVPVITEAEKVSLALRWAINEMERRYRVLGAVKVRNLTEFNARRIPAEPQFDEDGNPIPDKMPFIVIIIDEMADVMLHAQKEVEKNLALIVAKSRAVGIHTIIATQRPDVKVITGTIKANYPVRIAFQVSSQIDARTIMDNKGAESLLGRGDMLFKGAGNIERIQGGWVDTPEIENIVNFVSAFADQEFDESVFQALEVQDTEERGRNGSAAGSRTLIPGLNEEMDSEERLIQDAIEVVLRDRRPTISYLQRTLKVGYNKAATLIDELEDRGIIGPQPSSGLREILVLAPPTRDADDDDSGKVSNLDDV